MTWISNTIPRILRQSNLKFSRRSRMSPFFRRAARHSLGPSCNTSPLINSEIMCVYMASLTWRVLKPSYALSGWRVGKMTVTTTSMPPKAVSQVIFHLRDINQAMTNAWEKEFAPYSNTVKVSHSFKKKCHILGPLHMSPVDRAGPVFRDLTLPLNPL